MTDAVANPGRDETSALRVAHELIGREIDLSAEGALSPPARDHRIYSGFVEGLSRNVIEPDEAIEPFDLGKPLMAEAALVIVEWVNNYFRCATVCMICRVHSRRRARLIHKRDRE